MANPIPFHSKSATLVDKKKLKSRIKDVQKAVDTRHKIALVGEYSEEFLICGKSLGFTLRKYQQLDPSSLAFTDAYIMSEMETKFIRYLSSLEFARMYSIPTIWLHRRIEPGRFAFSFDLCIVGDYNNVDAWRKICQVIV